MSSSIPPLVRTLTGLRELASQYDGFLVDLHGVVHDGARPFDGTVDALRGLSRAGRRVVFVTNSSRAATVVEASLIAMGIGPDLYDAVLTSGDVTRAALLARDPPLFELLPEAPRCLHVGAPAYVPWLFEPALGLSFVEDLGDADLVIATGTAPDPVALAQVIGRLVPAAARGVPLVCTNPDRVIPTADGLTLGPGAIAAAYEALGPRVFLYGKPHPAIYAAADGLLDAWKIGRDRVVAIGDLLDTDVRGARAAGIASVMVTATGGHAEALGRAPTAESFDELWATAGFAPDMTLARLVW